MATDEHKAGLRFATALGIFFVSASLMSAEIVLTRIFSVVVWYHFAFFAISVALFGLGAAALVVQLFQTRLLGDRASSVMVMSSLAEAATLVVVDLVLTRAAPEWVGAPSEHTADVTLGLAVFFGVAAAPFFAGGLAIAIGISRYSPVAHRLYGSDLAGAGLGSLVSVPLLGFLDGPRAVLGSALFATLGAFAFATSKTARWQRAAAGALGFFLVVLAVMAPRLALFDIPMAKGMRLSGLREYERWNSFSMVTVLPQAGFVGWAPSPYYRGPIPEQKTLVIDLNAMTPLTRLDGPVERLPHLSFDLASFVYWVRPRADQVCVIGAGGGKDVLAALASGARRVTAVELNPLIANDVMRGQYRDFTGNLYGRDDVHPVVDDGRSFIRRSSERWDVIQLSMVDTSAATAAGAYALAENGLYTADAFGQFFERLKPRGVLSVASLSLPDLAVGARLVSVARLALERSGKNAVRSVAVLAAPWTASADLVVYDVLVAPDGFDLTDIARIAATASRLGFFAVYVPGTAPILAQPEQQWIFELVALDTRTLGRNVRSWPLDLSPSTDDRPFFFYQNRLRDVGRALVSSGPSHLFGNGLVILAKLTLVSFLMVLTFLLLPMRLGRDDLVSGSGSLAWDAGYVICLGFGFMLIEVPLLQRFALHLGNPTATLSVVLFVLLLSSGVGSRVLARGDLTTLPLRLRRALLGTFGYVLLLLVVASRLLNATTGWSSGARAGLVAVLLVPLGLLLGAALPAALRVIAERAPRRVPWLFCLNSATSVLGSVVATLIALHFGISAALFGGATLYLVALALSVFVMPGLALGSARELSQ